MRSMNANLFLFLVPYLFLSAWLGCGLLAIGFRFYDWNLSTASTRTSHTHATRATEGKRRNTNFVFNFSSYLHPQDKSNCLSQVVRSIYVIAFSNESIFSFCTSLFSFRSFVCGPASSSLLCFGVESSSCAHAAFPAANSGRQDI